MNGTTRKEINKMFDQSETPELIREFPNGKLYKGNISKCNECKHIGPMEEDFDIIFHDRVVMCKNCGTIIGTFRETPGPTEQQKK